MKIRDRIKELRRVKASELLPNPLNWRSHPQAQADALRGILAEVGFASALLARETPAGLQLIDGHLRAETAPDEEVPVLVLDVDEAEAKKLLACFDPLGAMAEADKDKLDALLKEIQVESPALDKMLADVAAEAMVGDGGAGEGEAGEVTEDEAPEPPVQPVTRAGDLWHCGDHRVLCGDSTKAEDVQRVMGGDRADLILTDPPYGVDFKRGQFITDPSRPTATTRGVGDEIKGDGRKADDQAAFIESVFSIAKEHCRPVCSVYMFSAPLAEGAHSMFGLVDAGIHIQSQLVWVKNNHVLGQADYHWKHEICWYGWYHGSPHRWFGERNKFSTLEFDRIPSTFHPNEKPVKLIGYLMANSSLPGELVYEPFSGSGSCIAAAEQIGRRCFAIELDPAYVDCSLLRWAKLAGREPTLAATGQTFAEVKAERLGVTA